MTPPEPTTTSPSALQPEFHLLSCRPPPAQSIVQPQRPASMQVHQSAGMRLQRRPGVPICSSRQRLGAAAPVAAAAAAARTRVSPTGRRAQVVRASAGSGTPTPQPLADVAFGAGRGAAALVNAITNPKEDKALAKERRKWREEQEAEKRRAGEEAAAAEEQELQQQQGGEQLVDPLGLPLAAEQQQHQHQQQLEGVAADAVVAADAATVGAAEALATAGAALQQQQHSIVSEYTEELVEEVPKTAQQRLVDARQFLASTATGKGLSAAAGLFLGATLAIALVRTWQKYSSPRAQRMRVIDKNKLLVEELSKFLPHKRGGLTPGVVRRLRASTGFSPVEVFRKYLWFLLRERQFDAPAVEDMVLLKGALALRDDEVAEALKERAQRIYDKYGTLMLNTEGMTPEGVERKAACRALFSKLLFLTEHEPLVASGSEAFRVADLHTIFGATDEDVEGLRIVSLTPFDIDRMESMVAGSSSSSSSSGEGSSSESSKGGSSAEGGSSSTPDAGSGKA